MATTKTPGCNNKFSDDNETVDFEKLDKEVNEAFERDARYWRENDAKLRALHQKVGTYEEFR